MTATVDRDKVAPEAEPGARNAKPEAPEAKTDKRRAPKSPEARAKLSEIAKARWQDPELRAQARQKANEYWADPAKRQQARERAMLSPGGQNRWTPERKAAASARAKAFWADPANVEAQRARARATQSPEVKARRAEAIRRRALNSAKPSKVSEVYPGAVLKGVTVLALVPGSETEAPYRQRWICECNSCREGLLVRTAEKLVYRPEKKTSCGCRQLKAFERENKRREGLLEKLKSDVAARREVAEAAWQSAQSAQSASK